MSDLYAEQQEELCRTHVMSLATLLPLAKLKQEFIFEGAVPARAITVLLGQPASKKSWLAYDMAIALARGKHWLDFDNCGKGRVLLLNYDNPTPELGRRLLRLGAQPTDDIMVHTFSQGVTMLSLPEHFGPLQAIVRKLRPKLIVIDSFRQSHTLDESNSQQMAAVMACLKQLTENGAGVLIIHHSRKAPAGVSLSDQLAALDSMRGSSEIAASSDCIISIRDGKMTWIKTRGWYLPDDDLSYDFDLVDAGARTMVRGV